MDRKEMIKILSEALGVKPKYLGVPSFAYEIKIKEETCTIDRQGGITTSQGREVTLDEILNGQQQEEVEQVIEEKIEDTVIDGVALEIPFGEHTGKTLLNILNMIYSKQKLIIKSLEITEPFMDETFVEDINLKKIETLEEFQTAITEVGDDGCKGITFNFEKGTFTFKLLSENLNPEKISAFIELVSLISENAQKLKYTSFKQSQDDNPKYAFRTWLIRLGMNGSKYKVIRKTLLSNLEGSAAYRKISNEEEVQVNG